MNTFFRSKESIEIEIKFIIFIPIANDRKFEKKL